MFGQVLLKFFSQPSDLTLNTVFHGHARTIWRVGSRTPRTRTLTAFRIQEPEVPYPNSKPRTLSSDPRQRLFLDVDGRPLYFFAPDSNKGQPMSDHRYIVVPRADRYGHPEGVNLTGLELTGNEHRTTAPHCDKYGHVVGDEQRRAKPAAETRDARSEFVLR
jgi:hypothetical protein